MSLSEIEQTAFAYYVAVPANDVNIAGRYFPYKELALILEDKFSMATRKFGPKARATATTASKAFLDTMLEQGAWSTKPNEFGGEMHQFQPDVYRAALRELQASDPIVRASQGQGPEFWVDKFAALTGA
ncbi:MAG: hypothetical protein ABIT04_06190 [Novosphingobium sp.]